MCYDGVQKLERALEEAQAAQDPDEIKRLQDLLEFHHQRVLQEGMQGYHLTGFDFPEMIVVTADGEPKLMEWGLVAWPIRDPEKFKASRYKYPNLNARSETMFSSKSFKKAVRVGRVLVPMNGFFEHHHKGKATFPYFIYPKNKAFWWFAGISINDTFAIVTTEANELMSIIHNNPKLKGPRMPVILDEESAQKWLAEYNEDEVEEAVLALCKPYDEDQMASHTVGRLRGKNRVGDVPEVLEQVIYSEL